MELPYFGPVAAVVVREFARGDLGSHCYRPPEPEELSAIDHTFVELANGNVIEVEGDLETTEKKLSDAARSGQSRLAWFKEHGTGHPVGVNPDQVAVLRSNPTD